MVPPFIVTCDTPLRDFNRSAADRRRTVLGDIFREAIRTVFSTVINVFLVFGYFCHSSLQSYVYGELRPSKLVIINQEDIQLKPFSQDVLATSLFLYQRILKKIGVLVVD